MEDLLQGWTQRWTPQLRSLVRIVFALTFLEHGTQKLFAFPAAPPAGLGAGLMLFTGLLETVGGILLAIGLFTRVTAFILAGEMAVGYWWIHAPHSFFPILNGGEAMVLYTFAFLYFAATDGGPWSVDAAIRKR